MTPAALSVYRPLPGARARLAAFPHAGGGASAFRSLAAALATRGIELCPLQAPGRENRIAVPFHESAEAMAEEFAAALATLPPLPTAFIGHSFGGLVAYLAARISAAEGAPPFHLVASASLSPIRKRAVAIACPDLPSAAWRERILALGGIPAPVAADPALFALFEPVIRADLDLARRYDHPPTPPLPCPITVYSASNDLAAPFEAGTGWRGLTAATWRRRAFEGGHFFLYGQVETVASALVEDLDWR